MRNYYYSVGTTQNMSSYSLGSFYRTKKWLCIRVSFYFRQKYSIFFKKSNTHMSIYGNKKCVNTVIHYRIDAL